MRSMKDWDVRSISWHATDECRKRHGFTPTSWDADLAVLDIIEGRAALLEQQENGRERYEVWLGFVRVTAIYEPRTATIVTVLPEAIPACP